MQKSVLLIDGSAVTADMTAQILRDEGYLVATTSNGEDAQDILNSERFDYIMADTDMADLSGKDFIRRVAMLDWNPAIILCGEEGSENLELSKELALSYSIDLLATVSHPIDKADLMRAFRRTRSGFGGSMLSETEFMRGLMTDGLIPIFQPRINLKDNTVAGVEVFARWQSRDGGMLGAQAVLSLAREKGYMDLLTYRMMELAIENLGVWVKDGLNLAMAINLSAANMLKDDFVDVVTGLADQFHVPHELITLKIGGTQLTSDKEKLITVMALLNKRGFNLALDNFSAAFGSLMRMHQIPFDELIVDRDLIEQALKVKTTRIILESAVELTHKLDLKSACAGIEDKELLVLARELGVDLVQGYYLAHPMPTDDFKKWYMDFQDGILLF